MFITPFNSPKPHIRLNLIVTHLHDYIIKVRCIWAPQVWIGYYVGERRIGSASVSGSNSALGVMDDKVDVLIGLSRGVYGDIDYTIRFQHIIFDKDRRTDTMHIAGNVHGLDVRFRYRFDKDALPNTGAGCVENVTRAERLFSH